MSDFTVELATVQLPDFGLPAEPPQVPADEYAARLAEAQRRAAARGLDILVVYGYTPPSSLARRSRCAPAWLCSAT